jgi:small-conductance mechanosensitive channel
MIVFVFYLFAYAVRRFVVKFIEHLAQRTKTDLDNLIVAEIKSPVFSTVVWVGVNIAIISAGLATGIGKFSTPIIMTFILVIWLRVGMNLSSVVFNELSRTTKYFKQVNAGTQPLLTICSKILVLMVSSYTILLIWGINPVGLIASAGVVGIAVGFAAKDSLANLFSGMFILADKPYKLGDYINLDSGERGEVTHIGIRSTRILTRDDIEVSIPNGIMGNAKIINESGGPNLTTRIRITLQVAYGTELESLHSILLKITANHEGISLYPNPRVRVRGFADSGINVQLLCWIDDPRNRGLITHLLYMDVHKTLAEHNIEIPYPRRDVHVFQQDKIQTELE